MKVNPQLSNGLMEYISENDYNEYTEEDRIIGDEYDDKKIYLKKLKMKLIQKYIIILYFIFFILFLFFFFNINILKLLYIISFIIIPSRHILNINFFLLFVK